MSPDLFEVKYASAALGNSIEGIVVLREKNTALHDRSVHEAKTAIEKITEALEYFDDEVAVQESNEIPDEDPETTKGGDANKNDKKDQTLDSDNSMLPYYQREFRTGIETGDSWRIMNYGILSFTHEDMIGKIGRFVFSGVIESILLFKFPITPIILLPIDPNFGKYREPWPEGT